MASTAVGSATQTLSSSSFLPTLTPSPTTFCANQLLIQLTTTLLVPDYSRFYSDAPINSFQPVYFPLADGSLVTRPLIDDILHANVCILVTGILVMLFARNIFVSADYLRRANLKDKSLFYVLFVSQMLAFVALVPMVVSQFNQSASCSVLDKITTAAMIVSLSLLVIWILGYKAYRCLDSSRLVVAILLIFLLASSAAGILELITLRSERRLSGACMRASNLRWIRIYLILLFSESFFICACFLLSIWRTRHSPGTRGRISLQLSLNRFDIISSEANHASVEKSSNDSQKHVGVLAAMFRPRHGNMSTPSTPQSQPHQPSVRISESASRPRAANGQAGRSSPAPSTLSRMMPRIDLFRDVLKDELYHITFITASCVGVAATTVFGVNTKNGLTVLGWASVNWAVISLLAVSSFGRVIRRHERDIILREPETWISGNLNPVGLGSPGRHRQRPRPRHSYSFSLNSNARSWRKPVRDESGETAALNGPRDSWHSSAPSQYSQNNLPVNEERPLSLTQEGALTHTSFDVIRSDKSVRHDSVDTTSL